MVKSCSPSNLSWLCLNALQTLIESQDKMFEKWGLPIEGDSL